MKSPDADFFLSIIRYIKIVICVLRACVTFWTAYSVHTTECNGAKFWHVLASGGKCIVLELGPPTIDGPPSARDHLHHCSPLV